MCKCDKEGEIRLQQQQFYSMMIQSVKALRRKNKRNLRKEMGKHGCSH